MAQRGKHHSWANGNQENVIITPWLKKDNVRRLFNFFRRKKQYHIVLSRNVEGFQVFIYEYPLNKLCLNIRSYLI